MYYTYKEKKKKETKNVGKIDGISIKETGKTKVKVRLLRSKYCAAILCK